MIIIHDFIIFFTFFHSSIQVEFMNIIHLENGFIHNIIDFRIHIYKFFVDQLNKLCVVIRLVILGSNRSFGFLNISINLTPHYVVLYFRAL